MDHSKIKWIFFDMGHTLLDEDGVHISRLEALTEELAAEGKTLPPVEEMLTEMIDFGTKGARSPFGEIAKNTARKRNTATIPPSKSPSPKPKSAYAAFRRNSSSV